MEVLGEKGQPILSFLLMIVTTIVQAPIHVGSSLYIKLLPRSKGKR